MALIAWHGAPLHKGVFPSILLGVSVLFAALIIVPSALADGPTPFVEINNKVGDISEEHGYVVALGHKVEDSEYYLVLVVTDTMQHVVINATAEKDVVKESLIGREVIIRAEVTESRLDPNTKQPVVKLRILSVRSLEKRDSG
ncbi:MAG: hypothetical protein QGD90_11445 [Candidatus Hydrogenedentes bacterium]|nr:hypothetical protein [Candidatus Hydrogenedentota bacterium]